MSVLSTNYETFNRQVFHKHYSWTRILYIILLSIFLNLNIYSQSNLDWAVSYGGESTESIASMTMDGNGNIYSFGTYYNNIDVDPGLGYYSLNSIGTDSILYIDLSIANSSFSDVYVTTCNQYISPSSNYTWTNSGVYYDTLLNEQGCDSIITISLTIPVVDTTIYLDDNMLFANSTGVNYQWLDCNDNFEIIPAATNQFYIPETTGSYCVEITNGNCIDTSSCINYSPGNILDFMNSNSAVCFPNPVSNILSINTGQKHNSFPVEIFNSIGNKVISIKLASSDNSSFDVSDLKAGIYFIRIRNNDRIQHLKFIKE